MLGNDNQPIPSREDESYTPPMVPIYSQNYGEEVVGTKIIEFFGYAPGDKSDEAIASRASRTCPFVSGPCQKTLSDSEISGVCTLAPASGAPVICCPQRLYANFYSILKDVAVVAFGPNAQLVPGSNARSAVTLPGMDRVAVFGKRWGGELRLPNRGSSGGYFVDWILAKLTTSGEIDSFVAVEVQSIDTTGNYRAAREAYLNESDFDGVSTAGFNWENVNKRILPQLIYKGHVLRRERLCSKGLFFISPLRVYLKIKERLGSNLLSYNLQSGSLSFMWYDIGESVPQGNLRSLDQCGVFTTTVDQVALAFTSPSNLPPQNVYEQAIRNAIL
jgi:hypothetical protein